MIQSRWGRAALGLSSAAAALTAATVPAWADPTAAMAAIGPAGHDDSVEGMAAIGL